MDNTTGPSLSISSPAGNNTSATRLVTITYAATSFSFANVTLLAVYYVNGSTANTTYTTTYGATNISIWVPSDDHYNFSLTVYDLLGRSAVVNRSNITVDSTPPTFSGFTKPDPTVIYTPFNATWNSSNVTLNFTTSDFSPFFNCSYQLDDAQTWTTIPCLNNTLTNATLSPALTNITGTHLIQVKINDSSGNIQYASHTFVVDTAGTPTTAIANSSGNTSITSGTLNVLLNSTTSNSNVTGTADVIGAGTTAINLTLVNLTSTAGTVIANLTGTLNITVTGTTHTYVLSFPTANTVITGPANWSGTLQLPTVMTTSSVSPPTIDGATTAVVAVVEVGFPGGRLNLSSPARLLLVGQGGATNVGWSQTGGTLTAISATCTSDAAAGLGSNNECVIYGSAGGDLIIWTNHFTSFATYTQTVNPSNVAPSSGSTTGGGSYAPGTGSACTPAWTCGTWASCQSDGTQTRTCTDSNSCGVGTGKPPELQACAYTTPPQPPTPPACTPSWGCTDWSDCSSAGTQARTCTDSNSCGVTSGKPAESESCTYIPPLPSTPPQPGTPSTTPSAEAQPASGGMGWLASILGVIVVIGIIGAVAYFLLKPAKGKKGL